MQDELIDIEITDLPAFHGGAWKVAYADFVTAMMAFFLLLWLLNVTTQEERDLISNYFDPSAVKVSDSSSGAGGVLGGLSMTSQGAMATSSQNISMPRQELPKAATQAGQTPKATQKSPKEAAKEKAKEKLRKKEEEKLKKLEADIKKAIDEDPELKALAKNLMIDMTPEGLRIQIVDQEGEPMFASGSAKMFEKTKKLIGKVAELVKAVENEVSIRGHTDSVPYGTGADYTNWELSSDRANSTRRALKETGIPEERLNNVMGKADTEHLFPETPNDPRNRRVSMILLKEELTNPEKFEADAEAEASEIMDDGEAEETGGNSSAPVQIPIGTFKKTPGAVEFP